MQNPYQTLGVNQGASPDEIKQAYRRLASRYHPDKGGDKVKFQEIQSAYDTLTDPQKRQTYDNPNPFGPGVNFSFRSGSPFDFENIFNAFGTQFHHQQPPRNQHARMNLWITLEDVAHAGKKTVSVGTTQGNFTVEIEILPGLEDGNTVQYPGIGPNGLDLIVTFRIHNHPRWERSGPNLTTEHSASVWDLIVGADAEVRDIMGNTLSVTIPPRTQPGTVFRLKNRGLKQRNGPNGDLFVRVQARIPDHIPESIITAIESIRNQ
jgi:curved DNA-binding protein